MNVSLQTHSIRWFSYGEHLAVLLCLLLCLGAAPSTQKRLIIFNAGNDLDWAHALPQRLQAMQAERPFVDGFVLHTGATQGCPNFGFNRETWTPQSLWFDDLRAIARSSTRFHDNFLIYWPQADNAGPDFFDDALWAGIVANAKLFSKAVSISEARGVFFDPEYYAGGRSYSPWWYDRASAVNTPPYVGRGQSFPTVQSKARQRGGELMRALHSEKPDLVLLSSFLYSGVWTHTNGHRELLATSQYALLPAFVDGMLDAMGPGETLVDGNEDSYYLDESRKYEEVGDNANYAFARRTAPSTYCAPELLEKWNRQGQTAMAPYFDFCFNLHQPQGWRTPNYESKWWRHNVYHSLLTTDQFAWAYFEKFSFWKDAPLPSGTHPVRVMQEAVNLVRDGAPLGYDMCKPADAFQFHNETPAIFFDGVRVLLSTTVEERNSITLTAAVEQMNQADVGVASVALYVDGQVRCRTNTAPYEFTISRPRKGATLFARVFMRDGTHMTSAAGGN